MYDVISHYLLIMLIGKFIRSCKNSILVSGAINSRVELTRGQQYCRLQVFYLICKLFVESLLFLSVQVHRAKQSIKVFSQ